MVYRVVQWATGAMGTAVLRGVIDHPALELVGVFVYGEEKEGLDAGVIARRPDTGVIATRSVEDILALDADVVIHASRLGPYGSHDDEIIALLESGKNVISINGYSHPGYWPGPRAAALAAAGEKGGATLVSAGLNPGFVGEQLAVVASGLTMDLDSIEIVENVDSTAIRNPGYLFGTLGFGSDSAKVDPNDVNWGPVSALNGMFEEAVGAVAARLGLVLDTVETDHRVYAAPHDLELRAGLLKRGTVSHTNWRWTGIVGGRPMITISINWYVDSTHLDRPDPPLWQVNLVGHPGATISVDLHKHPSDTTKMTSEQYAVAAAVVNTVPQVCAAPAGLLIRPVVTPFRGDFDQAGAARPCS
ncbi:hypothetical protein RDE2_12370 [Rhodococcus sp. RDE2]|nr:hypothetical protein RDE2_12370 [Rhodococcus sp. RDE2]